MLKRGFLIKVQNGKPDQFYPTLVYSNLKLLAKSTNIDLNELYDALRNLIPFVEFKVLQPVDLLKVTLLRGCFSNCTSGTKSRKA